jgi:hypothetical protein
VRRTKISSNILKGKRYPKLLTKQFDSVDINIVYMQHVATVKLTYDVSGFCLYLFK